jgi:hypothetical protein
LISRYATEAGRDAGVFEVPAVPVDVVGTVRAGDASMSALLAGLHERGLLGASARPELTAIEGDRIRPPEPNSTRWWSRAELPLGAPSGVPVPGSQIRRDPDGEFLLSAPCRPVSCSWRASPALFYGVLS